MANGNYSVGSDTTLTIIANGSVLASQILTSFDAKQMTTRLKSVGIDGRNRYRELEEGWEGNLEYDKADSVLDDFFAAKEAGRYAGQQPPKVIITQTDTNTDGSISKYRFEGVTLKLDAIGARTGDKKVEQKVSFAASRRKKVL